MENGRLSSCYADIYRDTVRVVPCYLSLFRPLAAQSISANRDRIRGRVLRGNRVGRPSPTPVGSPKSHEIDPVALAGEHLLSGFSQRLSGVVVRNHVSLCRTMVLCLKYGLHKLMEVAP